MPSSSATLFRGWAGARRGALVVAVALLASACVTRAAPAEALRLGAVNFVASGSDAAQPHFQRGVAALHSFWYEEALTAFHRTLELDPDFAMAWWGIAMAYHRPYLPGSDDAAGRAALARIGDTSRLSRREAAYIAALRVYYSDQPWAERTLAYAAAMETVHRRFPDDPEAATFYSLSLLGYGWSVEEGFARQERAAAVASEVYRQNPNHPGAAHYLIHSFDHPSLAKRGLEAARHYATIAPDAPHALHMPSHIFLQLGLWSEVAASNEAAWFASESWVQRRHLPATQRDYHNYHWLIYACLQQGRYAKAAELVREFQRMQESIDQESWHFLNDALASYVVETRNWSEAEGIFAAMKTSPAAPPATGGRTIEFCGGPSEDVRDGAADMPSFIRALAAAALGSPEAEARLAALRQAATVKNTVARFWSIRFLGVAALRQAQRRDFAAAIKSAREAVKLEETFEPAPGPPSSIKPPHELAGEILLAAGQPAEALVQFRKALERHPNRALALLGRARSEVAANDPAAAAVTYARFLDVWREADANLPELREGKAFMARNPPKR